MTTKPLSLKFSFVFTKHPVTAKLRKAREIRRRRSAGKKYLPAYSILIPAPTKIKRKISAKYQISLNLALRFKEICSPFLWMTMAQVMMERSRSSLKVSFLSSLLKMKDNSLPSNIPLPTPVTIEIGILRKVLADRLPPFSLVRKH